MINGSIGLNVRTLGVSRDMTMQAAVPLGGRYMLIQDDPALVAQAKAAGFITIYRQSGDDTDHNVLATDPVQFVQTRAEKGADYVHLTNEVASSSALHQWTRRALEYATSIGVKACAYNYATNSDQAQWEAAKPTIVYAIGHGHSIGFHQYPDNIHDDGGLAWRTLKQLVGGKWIGTEFNYCRDIVTQAEHGWRGKLSQEELIAFFAKWLPTFAAENVPVLTFSFDDWRPNADGKANGFGVHDAPNFLQGLAVLNVKYPIQEHPVNPIPPYLPGANPSPKLVNATAGLKLRTQPTTSSTSIRIMPYQEAITVYAQPVEPNDGYNWQRVTDVLGNNGWSANAVNGVPTWVDPAPPANNWTVELAVPYVSQTSQDANKSFNDCGIASLLMLTRYWFGKHHLLVPTIPSVDDCEPYTPLANNPPPKGLSFADVAALSSRLGFTSSYGGGYTLDKIRQNLLISVPMFLLLNYAIFNPADVFDGAHFAVVKGYNDRSFLFADPYHGGDNYIISATALDAALQNVPGNIGAYQGFELKA